MSHVQYGAIHTHHPQPSCANLLFLCLSRRLEGICMHGHSSPFTCSALWTEMCFCFSLSLQWGEWGKMTLAVTASTEMGISANDHRAGHRNQTEDTS